MLMASNSGTLADMDSLAFGAPKPARFWQFAGAVMAGNVAALATGYFTRKLSTKSSDEDKNLAAAFAGAGMFWLVGGLTWAALTAD